MKAITNEQYSKQYEELFSGLDNWINSYTKGDNVEEERQKVTPINNLIQYYRALNYCIEKMSKEEYDTRVPLPYKYYRVPLDEPYFTVDMSTRIITVPKEFQRNGIGCKGDAYAEILFFEIDRLYDLMDLDAIVKDEGNGGCWIQWTNTSTKKSGNSPAIFDDTAGEKLYIAWVVTPEMTEEAGNIDFALRFFTTAINREDDTEYIDYSISTQKASVSIKSTLDLKVIGEDKVEVEKNLQDLIMHRPVYSGIIDSLNGPEPWITTNLDSSVTYDLETSGELYDEYEEGYPRGAIKFKVEAVPVENIEDQEIENHIEYNWYSGNERLRDPNPSGGVNSGFATKNEYVVTKGGTYYCKVGNVNNLYGTRYLNSNTVVVPTATNITYDPKEIPVFAYSITEDHKGTPEIIYKEYNFKVEGNNGTVEYDWYVTDLDGVKKDINDVVDENNEEKLNEGIFIPKVDEEFILWSEATNWRNNTKSNTITTNKTTYRAVPQIPDSVTIDYIGYPDDKNIFQIVANVDFGDKPSGKHEKEWKYRWVYSVSNDATNYTVPSNWIVPNSNGKMLQPTLKRPTNEGDTIQYNFTCYVSHGITDSTGRVISGPEQDSNNISVIVTRDSIYELTD